VLILRTGTALLALLAIKTYRIGWQVLLIVGRSTAAPALDRHMGRRAWKAWWQ
jgi:hypothetical protein